MYHRLAVSFPSHYTKHTKIAQRCIPISHPRKKKVAVPLWHRATEEIDCSGAGSVLYSDLIGHTYSVLVGPKRTANAGK